MKAQSGVKRPIRRSLLVASALFLVALVVSISAIVHVIFSSAIYTRFDTKLRDVIAFVEHSTNADDLARCIQTGQSSPERDELQHTLNELVDDFELQYLYLVIPGDDVMVNVISATSDAERAAGETDMALLERVDAYSAEELAAYRSHWDDDDISYFEESSGFGKYYTAVKPLRDPGGNTVALMCADVSVDVVRSNLTAIFGLSTLAALAIFGIFVAAISWWMRKSITGPLLMLEESARAFAARSHEANSIDELRFTPPNIHTGNEIETLTMTITKMASDIRLHMSEVLSAQAHASEMDRENVRLAEEARSAKKIAELSDSVTSLLTHMPGLTFSKDAETGIYLACNQAFAEYANKPNPDGVVGLTDHQIFDPVTAQHFVDDDKKTMSMSEPFIFFEDVYDGAGNPKQFQTTKIKFYDTKGRLCLLGMCVDVTDLMTAKRESLAAIRAYETIRDESLTYYSIARTLSDDYYSLYYIDLNTNAYVEYRLDGTHKNLVINSEGDDFFASAPVEAERQVYAADRQRFVETLAKSNIERTLDAGEHVNLSYRLIVNGEPTYMGLKASRAAADEDHVVIGISNIDAQMKQREAARRMQEEQTTFARITALAGDYLAVYAVDPDTNHYVRYRTAKNYASSKMLPEGDDFFAQMLHAADFIVHKDDLGMVQSLFIKERMVSDIRAHGIFVMNFRMLISGEYKYVSMRAALVEEADGPQLIVGLTNIDNRIKRDQEFALVQSRANRDALTGVKNKHAYTDAENALNERIDAGEDVEFAIVVCDLNNLKLANDTQGHQAGDRLLKEACSIICDVFKHSPVFRIGGDEFVVILTGHDYRNANLLLQNLSRINARNAATGNAVIAWGVSDYQGSETVADVFSRADVAMYETKRELKTLQA